MNKSELRKAVLEAVGRLSEQERRTQSGDICKRAIEWVSKNRSFRVIGVFRAFGAEVDLEGFCQWAFTKNLRLGLPVISSAQKGSMTFREFRPGAKLQKNRFGIEEPLKSAPDILAKDFDVMFVPGTAFTAEFQRLGRGQGFYDRFLFPCPDVVKIGVGFSCQLVDSLPTDPHDVHLNGLLLPERFLYTS